MTTTPDAAPQKDGLLVSAYRIMTAPFLMRTPKNIATRNKKRKSSPKKVCINEIADNLTSKAESTNATSLRTSSPNDSMKMPPPNKMYLLNAHCEKSVAQEVQIFQEFVKDQVGLFPPNSSPKNHTKSNKHLRNFDMDQSVEEVNEQGSYQPPDRHDVDRRCRSRSPETSSPRERHRYNVTDRRYRYDGYLNRSDSSFCYQLTMSQRMDAKLFLGKIAYFNGSNNKEALNYLAQCEEAAQKMKAPETMVAWSKLSGRSDVV